MLASSNATVEAVRLAARPILESDESGHGLRHVERVRRLALAFAPSAGARVDLVQIAALLHDLDDYKLVGDEQAKSLTAARKILAVSGVPEVDVECILHAIAMTGFSKRVKDGVVPDTPEAKVLSDADMCDGLGLNAVIRTCIYGAKHGRAFFTGGEQILRKLDAEEYRSVGSESGVMHLCEKCLNLPLCMLTMAGKTEAWKRFDSLLVFLRAYFAENFAEEMLVQLDELERSIRSQAS